MSLRKTVNLLKFIFINIIVLLIFGEIAFAFFYLYKSQDHSINIDLLKPDYFPSKAKPGNKKHVSRKAKLVYDENGSPIYVDGIKTYFSHREYSANGLLLSDEEIIGTNATLVGIFGDSYTQGLQVPENETFVSLLEKYIKGLDVNVELINYAIGATGTIDQKNRLLTVINEHQLSNVVLFFLPQNDVLNNSPSIENNGTIRARSAPQKRTKNNNGSEGLRAREFFSQFVKNSFFARGLYYSYRKYQSLSTSQGNYKDNSEPPVYFIKKGCIGTMSSALHLTQNGKRHGSTQSNRFLILNPSVNILVRPLH